MTHPTGADTAPDWPNEDPHAETTPQATPEKDAGTERKLKPPRVPQQFQLTRLVVPLIYLGLAFLASQFLEEYQMVVIGVLLVLAVWTGLQYGFDRTRGRPVPELGAPKWARMFARALGLTYVPNRSSAELLQLAGRDTFDLLQTRSVIVGVYGPKGGVGKTTVASVIAWFVAFYSKKPCLAVDAREKRGNITEALGFWRRLKQLITRPSTTTTLTLRDALDLCDQGYFDDATDMFDLLPSVEGRMLHVIASDHIEDDAEWPIKIERVIRLFDVARRHYKFIIFETTDDVHSPLNRALLRVCDIPVFVHRVNMPNSLAETKQGFSIYRGEFGEKIRRHGVLFVLAATRGQTAQHFAEKFKGAVPTERINLIPKSKFYESDNTDVGHEPDEPRDDSVLPSCTRDIAKTPVAIAVRYVTGMNGGIKTVPPGVAVRSPRQSIELTSSDVARPIDQVPSTDAPELPQYT